MLLTDPDKRPSVNDLIKNPKIRLRLNEREMREEYSKLKIKEQEVSEKLEKLKTREAEIKKREEALKERELKA